MKYGQLNCSVFWVVICSIQFVAGVQTFADNPWNRLRRDHTGDKLLRLGGSRQPLCDSKPKLKWAQKGRILDRTYNWKEEGLPPVEREYSIYVPTTHNPKLPTGLVMIFHGWGDPDYEQKVDHWGKWPRGYHTHYGYGEAVELHNFIAIYPKGLADCANGAECADPDAGPLSSWNGAGTTESHGKSNTSVCDLSLQPFNYCYSSCRKKKGFCHRCDWTTCYDDVGFVRALLQEIEKNFCIDPDQIFATGCSNGGMFAHELAQRMPEKFAAVASNCAGKPHQGHEKMPESGPPLSLLLISGSNDKTIRGVQESRGKNWWDGFKYASNDEVIVSYKEYNKCKSNATRPYAPKLGDQEIMLRSVPYGLRQPFEHTVLTNDERTVGQVLEKGIVGNHSFTHELVEDVTKVTCQEAGYDCAGGVSIVSCYWKGGHDIRQGDPKFIMSFFKEHSRSKLKNL